uniref:Uncharacterized protein n=1 Tax=Strongyloides venezuelensis TaxID=75913 RepID=A0A0K0F0G1_STRVS
MNVKNFRNVVKLACSIFQLNLNEAEDLFYLYKILLRLTFTQKSIKLLSDVMLNCEICKFAVKYSMDSSSNVYFYENNKRSFHSKYPS